MYSLYSTSNYFFLIPLPSSEDPDPSTDLRWALNDGTVPTSLPACLLAFLLAYLSLYHPVAKAVPIVYEPTSEKQAV